MLTLIQIPHSPFCIGVRHILDRNGIPYRIHHLPPYDDRAAVIRPTKGRGSTVPCLLDGRKAVVDETDLGQEVARYLDRKFDLGLFPKNRDGIQEILARHIENDLESVGFKVTDSYLLPQLPLVQRVNAFRWKERKFGKGCVQQWAKERPQLCKQFAALLKPFDNMLSDSPFLLGDRPLFVDYDLFGIIGNYLYNGKTRLPPLRHLKRWHRVMLQRNA
jgi:glutathione S-transferase